MLNLARPFLALGLLTAAVAPSAGVGDDLPDLPEPLVLEQGVELHKVSLLEDQVFTRVWIYVPEGLGKRDKVPCVLIAPAGTAMWHGLGLALGDRPEHLPYAEAGCVVVAYSISGPVVDEPADEEFDEALASFLAAEGGVANAKMALDYALEKVPAIDPKQIYTAGHSSAGALSIQVAQSDRRVDGCIAFAPVTDLEAQLGSMADYLIEDFEQPELKQYIGAASPLKRVERLKCRTFLHHAEDDWAVPIDQTRAFAKALEEAGNEQVELLVSAEGGHYDSMIEAIPEAIAWIRSE